MRPGILLALSLAAGCRSTQSMEAHDAGSPTGQDASPPDLAQPSLPDAALDAAPDAVAGDGGPQDALAAPPDAQVPSVDRTLGPYASAWEIAEASLLSSAARLDTRVTYHDCDWQGQLIQGAAELLWATRGQEYPGRDRLLDAALGELAELEETAYRATSGGPAFGLDWAWDAFGDGVDNPPYTAYAYESGMVAVGLARLLGYLALGDHPERSAQIQRLDDFLRAMIEHWDNYFTRFEENGETVGYYWYSTEPADAIAVHNTSALIAVASELYAEISGDPRFSQRPRQVAALLAHRRWILPSGGYAWHYSDDGWPRPFVEDLGHAEYTLYLARMAYERGWWTDEDMRRICTTITEDLWTGHPARLPGAIDGTSHGAQDWGATRWFAVPMPLYAQAPCAPELFELARSVLVSADLLRHSRPLRGALVEPGHAVAMARLMRLRPAPFSADSRWTLAASASVAGGLAFCPGGWSAPAERSAADGLTLLGRRGPGCLRVDLGGERPRAVVVSLTYLAESDGLIRGPGGRTAPLFASRVEAGALRWLRTSAVFNPADPLELVVEGAVDMALVEVSSVP